MVSRFQLPRTLIPLLLVALLKQPLPGAAERPMQADLAQGGARENHKEFVEHSSLVVNARGSSVVHMHRNTNGRAPDAASPAVATNSSSASATPSKPKKSGLWSAVRARFGRKAKADASDAAKAGRSDESATVTTNSSSASAAPSQPQKSGVLAAVFGRTAKAEPSDTAKPGSSDKSAGTEASFPDGYPVQSRVKVNLPLNAEVVEPFDKAREVYTVKLQKGAWNKEEVKKGDVKLVKAYTPPKEKPGYLGYPKIFEYADKFEGRLASMTEGLLRDPSGLKGKSEAAVDKHNNYAFLLWKNHVLAESLKRNVDRLRASEGNEDEKMEAVFEDHVAKAKKEADLHTEVGEKYKEFMDNRMKEMREDHAKMDGKLEELMQATHPEPKQDHEIFEKMKEPVPAWVLKGGEGTPTGAEAGGAGMLDGASIAGVAGMARAAGAGTPGDADSLSHEDHAGQDPLPEDYP